MREASRDKATQLEEGGRKDHLDRRQPSFGTGRGGAIRSDCLDALDRALAHSFNDDHSQTVWLGDAVCTSHRNAKRTLAVPLGDIDPTDWMNLVELECTELRAQRPALFRCRHHDVIDAGC